MKCEIIRDLLPLYADECCSAETKAAVEEHINSCAECKNILESMTSHVESEKVIVPVVKGKNPVSLFRASVIQSIAMFLSFVILTVGVYFESASPYGEGNGSFAFALIVPTAGFMFSLVNWFFVRQYKSRFSFSVSSAAAGFGVTVVSALLMLFHYSDYSFILNYISLGGNVLQTAFVTGAILSLTLTAVSFFVSRLYATLVGKE